MNRFFSRRLRDLVIGALGALTIVSSPVSAAPGDTMWIPDVRIEGGVEVWVLKEMVQGPDNRWSETGDWVYMDPPYTVDDPM